MEPNPKRFPILSYVMSRVPQLVSKPATDPHDIEQPESPPRRSGGASSPSRHLFDQMPHLKDPKVIAAMTRAVSDVAQTRSLLQTLGVRPDHEAVDAAKAKISEIESKLATQLEEIVLSPRPGDSGVPNERASPVKKEDELLAAAKKELELYKAVVQLDEMHDAYEKLLKEAEDRLNKIYESAAAGGDIEEEAAEAPPEGEEMNEEISGILQEASSKAVERVDLSERQLRLLPEAFGKLCSLVLLDLSSNQLKTIPDSIAGLEKLEEFSLSSNLLESLPDSIGLLHNLKILNVSGNKLTALPDSISSCRSLVEFDASFNCLTYLPTNIGYELVNLRRLSVQLNKLRSLPSSVCEMRSLRILDAHFNELHGLPVSIGKLTNLEILNLSSNFNDMTELPESLGELTNLKELDISNNQIEALPDTFGQLDNLVKLNVDQNPLVIPPKEVVTIGLKAVKTFMAKRWLDILIEEEQKKNTLEVQPPTPTGWLSRSTSWLNNTVTGYINSPKKSPKDAYLDQEL